MMPAGTQRRRQSTAARLGDAALCAFCLVATFDRCALAQDEQPWEIAPYRIRVMVAVDDAARPQGDLQAAIVRTIKERTDSALRPLWALDVHEATTSHDRSFSFQPTETPWSELSAEERTFDKLLWLAVRADAAGFTLSCREFDATTRRWGPVLQRDVAQRTSLNEACFRLAAEAFTPLARIESTDDDGSVRLAMKGGKLPRPPGPDLLVAPGDVYLPLLRRVGRGGELAEKGIAPMPWTFLVTSEQADSDWLARVESALRSPFAARRRRGVEQIAVGLTPSVEPVRVHFYARSNPQQGLAGYEVFRLPPDKSPPQLLGLTDRNGMFSLPPGDEPVTSLILRSDGQVLAKLIVASGSASVLEAPIADDAVRLAAQGEVQAVREELIDVVARRALLIARIEAHLKKREVAEARELMDALNELPTPSVFANRIDQVHERLPKSEDPRVRQTVDALFSATREMLSRFLDARVITNLQAKVNEAVRGGT